MRSPEILLRKKYSFGKGDTNNEGWEINREQALIGFAQALIGFARALVMIFSVNCR